MKLILQIKLKPDNEQKKSLLNTIKEANVACNKLSEYAFENKIFNQFKLHRAKYHSIKSSFNLSAQMVVRCISKCADSYKLDKKKQRTFKELGAITYDERILSYNIEKRIASIWSVGGRLKIPFIPCPEKYLPYIKGEADMIYRKGKFYLFQTCEVPEEDIKDVEEFIGCDFGQKEICVLSDDTKFNSGKLNQIREKYFKTRKSIQTKADNSTSRSVKKNCRKVIKRLKGRENRFATISNHAISKQIVEKAKKSGKGIAIEDLTGIRKTAKIRKSQRRTMSNWSFYQLRQHLEYKSKLAGVPLVVVNPAYTSQICHVCKHIGIRNGKSFKCKYCGYSGDADYNASLNISQLGAIVNCAEKSNIFSCVLHN
jgi:IS605 OrfB family transposase